MSLVWITPDAERVVLWCARVSSPQNQDSENTRLLGYLIRNQHWSPFEMASMCIEIHTTRDIARQILRHRSFSFQEFSQRYAAVPRECIVREARWQDAKNRQNSIEIDRESIEHTQFAADQRKVWDLAYATYTDALNRGIAKEQARALLPEGLTPTTLLMSGTLRSWLHYCQLRRGNGTQKEHKEIAEAIWQILAKECPTIANEFCGELLDEKVQ